MTELSTFFKTLGRIIDKDIDNTAASTISHNNKYNIGDLVKAGNYIGKVEEIHTSGVVENISASIESPVYVARILKENDINEYTSSTETYVGIESELRPFEEIKNKSPQVGSAVKLKFNNGLGEVVYRTESSFVVRRYGQNGLLESSTTSYDVEDYYDYLDVPPNEYVTPPDPPIQTFKFDNLTFQKMSDGSLKVYGIYSSKYLDSDLDILTSESHKKFAEGVNNGEYPLPDIYIAHIPVTVGKCEVIDYDTDGFAVFGGTITKEWAAPIEEIIQKSIEANVQLGLSHGFYGRTVEYDEDGYISKYITHEISILPLYGSMVTKDGERIKIVGASNKYTALLMED